MGRLVGEMRGIAGTVRGRGLRPGAGRGGEGGGGRGRGGRVEIGGKCGHVEGPTLGKMAKDAAGGESSKDRRVERCREERGPVSTHRLRAGWSIGLGPGRRALVVAGSVPASGDV